MSLLSRVLDVRSEERGAAALMALIYFLILLAYYCLKPVRDSLFLVNVSPAQLPLVFILVAVVAAPVTALHTRLARGRPPRVMTAGTLLVLAASLIGMRFLVVRQDVWVYYLFYAWAGIVGSLTASQFWLLANAVFDATQAKRIFTMLAAGGILGAMAGGELTRTLVTIVGVAVPDLLLVAAGLLVLVLFLGLVVGRNFCPDEDPRAGAVDEPVGGGRSNLALLKTVHRSEHLRLTVGIMAAGVLVTAIADFQFKSIAAAMNDDAVTLTAFLGRFYGLTSLLSLMVQILLANRLIRWSGVGGVLLALPLVLVLGAGAVLAVPGLYSVSLLRGGELSLKHSLDRTGRELLFLPVPLALKQRTKVFIDLLVDRWFRGLAGLLLLGLTLGLGFSVRALTVPLLVLLGIWVFLIIRMRREYVDAFRQALERREIDLDDLRQGLVDEQTVGTVLHALREGTPRQILYALELADALADHDLTDDLERLLDHPSPDIRCRALKVLVQRDDRSLVDRVRKRLRDEAPEVRLAAVDYLMNASGGDPADALRVCLADGDHRVRDGVLLWLADADPALSAELLDADRLAAIQAERGEDGAPGRRAVARLLGVWPDDRAESLLRTALDDPDPKVAGQALLSFGRRGDAQMLPDLLEHLNDRRLRRDARRAVALLGEQAVTVVSARALSEEAGPVWQVQLVKVLGGIPLQTAVDNLLDLIVKGSTLVRHEALRALFRLRGSGADLDFRRTRLHRLQSQALETWYGYALCRRLQQPDREDPAVALLIRTLDEKMDLRLMQFLGLLALRHPPRDVRNAWLGLRSGRQHQRANAIEYIDQVLESDLREAFRPVALRAGHDEIRAAARTHFGLELEDADAAMTWIRQRHDPWLRACAAHRYGKEGEALFSVVEKVMLLQTVDVFEKVPPDDVSALALIATEVPVLRDDVIFSEGDGADALYLVLEGSVDLHRDDHVIARAAKGQAFGTWALLDESPRLTGAKVGEDGALLRIDRDDFMDLMADNMQIAQGIIAAIAQRLRGLAGH